MHSKRHGFLSEGEYHSVYDKGPVFPGGGVKKQHFFISVRNIIHTAKKYIIFITSCGFEPKGKIFPTFHLSAALVSEISLVDQIT